MSKEKTPHPRDTSEGNETATSPIRLLLIDDEKGYTHVLENRLAKRGIHVAKAHSGTEALRAMRHQAFDVAVLDLKMEDMDGIEVLRILKKMDPEMEVIMLTGHGSQTAAKQGIALGVFDYLSKPCEFDALLEKIRAAYRKRVKDQNF